MLLGVPEESGSRFMFPPTKVRPVPSATVSWPPSKLMAAGFEPKNPNAATGAAVSNASAGPGTALNRALSVSRR